MPLSIVRIGLASLLVLVATGCGARTGLSLAERDDGADAGEPDAPYGEFPCTYGRSGDLFAIGSDWPATRSPSAVWAADRLNVAFAIDREEPDDPHPLQTIELCAAEAHPYLACADRWELASSSAGDVALARGDGELALCWSPGSPGVVPVIEETRVDFLDDAGRPTGDGVVLTTDSLVCVGLAWAGRRYWALLNGTRRGDPSVVVMSFEPHGDRRPSVEFTVPSSPGHAVAALDAAADVVVLGGIESPPEELWVRGLSGTGFEEAVVASNAWFAVSVSVRGDQIGVLWVELGSPEGVLLRFALVDVDSGAVHSETVLVGDPVEWIGPIELEAVWDGFLVSYWVHDWSDREQLVVVPLRFGAADLMDVRNEIVLHEGSSTTIHHGLSLTDDGHVAFVAASLAHATTSVEQVHLQLLSCHR